MRSICVIDGCEGFAFGRGWCSKHYQRWERHGDPTRGRLTDVERFYPKVAFDDKDKCWEWLAGKDDDGYGKFHGHGGSHRFSYELFRGKIPKGMHLDHLCRNPGCVNPWHLEIVTCRENIRRGVSPVAVNAARTHCKHGHEFNAENTHVYQGVYGTCRMCITCNLESTRRRRKRKAA